LTLEDAIFEKLMATVAVVARTGARVYRGWRPQRAILPCVTFLRIDTVPVNGAAGASDTSRARVQVDVWAENQGTARTIADAVKSGLDGWTRTSSPEISPVLLISDNDFTEESEPGSGQREYRISQDYSIWFQA